MADLTDAELIAEMAEVCKAGGWKPEIIARLRSIAARLERPAVEWPTVLDEVNAVVRSVKDLASNRSTAVMSSVYIEQRMNDLQRLLAKVTIEPRG